MKILDSTYQTHLVSCIHRGACGERFSSPPWVRTRRCSTCSACPTSRGCRGTSRAPSGRPWAWGARTLSSEVCHLRRRSRCSRVAKWLIERGAKRQGPSCSVQCEVLKWNDFFFFSMKFFELKFYNSSTLHFAELQSEVMSFLLANIKWLCIENSFLKKSSFFRGRWFLLARWGVYSSSLVEITVFDYLIKKRSSDM